MQGDISQTEAIERVDDRELLRRFSLDADEAAFAEIVRRYERLVMSVCRRSIGSGSEADDAFQATFLTLARKPKQIRKIESLSSWLYSVAWRISARLVRARRKNPVQPLPEEQAAETNDPLQKIAAHQHAVILDEELQTLPDKYRDVLVMTYFAEQTSQQIASQLDVSKGTVDGRIRQARNMLRVKLARRGVGVGALFAAATLMKTETAAAAPSVVAETVSLGSQTISQSLPGTTDISHLETLVRPEITSMIGMKSLLTAVVGICTLVGLAGMGSGQDQGVAGGSVSGDVVDTHDVGSEEAIESSQATQVESTVAETEVPSEPIAVSLTTAESEAANETTASEPIATEPVAPFAFYPEDAQPTEKWLYESLDKPIPEMKFNDGSALTFFFEEIQRHFSDDAKGKPMHIWQDRKALDEAGINIEDIYMSNQINLSNMSLRSAINLVLGSLEGLDDELTVMVKNEVLMITTRVATEAEENYYIRAYDVASLLAADIGLKGTSAAVAGGGGGLFSVAQRGGGGTFGGGGGGMGGGGPAYTPSLVDVVMQMTSPPAQWQDTDGQGGSIALVGSKLVVRQNAEVHREIVKLLNLLVTGK